MKNWITGLIALSIFTSSAITTTASAVAIADGNYQMNILPYVLPPGLPVLPDYTSNDSQIAFNALPGSSGSNYFTEAEVGICLPGDIACDGVAGKLGLTISGGTISFTSFQVDPVLDTAGGDFSQSTNDTSMMSGITNASTTSFDLTGRVASMSAYGITDKKWDYAPFTTGTTASNLIGSDTGVAVANVGDINGDGVDDYTAVFKSAGEFGPEWGDVYPMPYFEVWNVEIVSAVPVPAALWLFGSGLLGLAGIARRRKA
ncbi:MAG: VPLPA-CTERM sorting domain-containing protein [Gammaproteobacteria bacterium]|nr:VPLPA-CTERM sorting domain-containing protein [Gammaproteobacteria bacterium]MDH5594429.1 VPLPA-CTERM sorting domain-containing protein [Gammaproteobacteria bacterium]